MSLSRRYRYVGPAEVRTAVQPGQAGFRIRGAVDFVTWVMAQTADELADPFTFVIDTEGVLLLAPRRSEHVACASAEPVLSAGEMSFQEEGAQWAVDRVSNQSTGYCPDTASWPAVAQALERADLRHPNGFTYGVVFRRCPQCQENNIVREEHYVCAFCDADLPQDWNVDAAAADPEAS